MTYQPVIGMMTLSLKGGDDSTSEYRDYIQEVNDYWIKWAGSKTISIPFDIHQDELEVILPQINGCLIGGGSLAMGKHPKTGIEHPYYTTAKRVLDYSKHMKDDKSEDWPVIGISKGLQVIAIYEADDDPKVLDAIDLWENRPVKWEVRDVKQETNLFKTFTHELVHEMEHQSLAMHCHKVSLSKSGFFKYPGLRKNMKITQTEAYDHNGKTIDIIGAMEGYDYPIFALSYHPEYHQFNVLENTHCDLIKRNTLTDEISSRLSLAMNRLGLSNSNRILP